MASSSPPRRSNDSDDENYDSLMSAITPLSTPAAPRKRNADHLDTSDVPLPLLDLALQHVNGNHLGAITAFATRKRLRPEQLTAVETFARDPIPVQLGKIFATCLANENTLAKFQAAKPTFEINSALRTNITRAVNAMLCSTNIPQYRGETGKSDIQSLLIRYRWGNFVIGTEHDQAAMDVVQKFIAEVFTQSRSIIKKELVKSVENPRAKNTGQKHVPSLRPKATHTTIYQLTKTVVQKLSDGKHISIPITPALCARRKWHVKKIEGTLKVDTDDYWKLVDDDLQEIRSSGRRDNTTDPKVIAKRVAKAFSFMLEKDRKPNPDEEIPDATTTVDDAAISYQADIDAALDARNQGQNLTTTGEGEGEQIESAAAVSAEAPVVETAVY
ncbi:hypothetical protein GGX14DRAFT_407291 [Mycena pura]|uniref:Uncharacterized protein n=1 Tax=Mycena pura TaxID=153505 RepID=A0AAD6Y0S3_9AGAR|nr:hypothetical protein GGX14DRAFT_407291 [Mycena pura]